MCNMLFKPIAEKHKTEKKRIKQEVEKSIVALAVKQCKQSKNQHQNHIRNVYSFVEIDTRQVKFQHFVNKYSAVRHNHKKQPFFDGQI